MTPCLIRSAAVLLCSGLLSSGVVLALEQQHPNLDQGFDPAKLYQYDGIETIDMYNGRLTLTIPLGQRYTVSPMLSYGLTLVYNSSIWYPKPYQYFWGDQLLYCLWADPKAGLNREWNAGAGFLVSLGELEWRPGERWTYISPDGADHEFYPTLHFEDDQDPWFYTRDGSYLRLHVDDSESPRSGTIDFPDGTSHVFQEIEPGTRTYRLSLMRDPYHDSGAPRNWVQVTYPSGNSRWTITDSHGRTHNVYFTEREGAMPTWVVDRVELAAPGGTTLVYQFSYETRHDVERSEKDSCYSVYPGRDETVDISVLTKVAARKAGDTTDLESWGFTEYHLTGDPGISEDRPGVLKTVRLPTGGKITYEFADRILYHLDDPEPCENEWCAERQGIERSTGVSTRQVVAGAGVTGGTWQYMSHRHTRTVDGVEHIDEVLTQLRGPDGNDTVYYFSPGINELAQPDQWHTGLPFTPLVADGDRRLSSQVFDGTAGVDCSNDQPKCLVSGTILRAQYAEWVRFPIQDIAPEAVHRLAKSERTYFADDPANCALPPYGTPPPSDGCRYSGVARSDFDGVGHFRQVVSQASFGAGAVRTSFTDYNPDLGTYPDDEAWAPPLTWWVLNTFASIQETEGSAVARREYCFEPSTGFLSRVRTLEDGSTRGEHDLLATFTADDYGNVEDERYFGGDLQALSVSDQCAPGFLLPDEEAFHIAHTYQYGSRKTSQYIGADGLAMLFKSLDCDVDQATGLYSACRDTAGNATSFVYDALGRRTWVKPSEGAFTRYQYLSPDPATEWNAGTNVARVEVCTRPNGSSEDLGCLDATYADTYTRSAYRYDGLGRLFKESTRLPASSLALPGYIPYEPNEPQAWNQRLTTYDSSGRIASVSEWQPNGTEGDAIKRTLYLDYDPFGRVGKIRPPDGDAHDVHYRYFGSRLVTHSVSISVGEVLLNPTDESHPLAHELRKETTEEYDPFGRLYQVTEPSGAAGAPVTTTYTYDVGNRLKGVSTTAGGITQSRSFLYDNRGFLRFEDLPEKVPPAGGRSGDCATHDVCYSDYDARGHVGRIHDGDHVLRHEYDRAERLLTVKALLGVPQAEYPIREFTYGESQGDSLGKLVQAVQHNRYDPADPGTDFPVTEDYTYAGLDGRVSSRATQVSSLGSCSQTFTWTALGEQESIGYPTCNAVGTERTITYEYASGFLTGVKQGTDTIANVSYHGNTMVNAIAHGNGVTVTYGPDPDAMRRPAWIATLGVTGTPGNWDTGAYTYDGAGNVKEIGARWYWYDGVSRLKGVDLLGGDAQCPVHHAIGYGYDSFGNRTRRWEVCGDSESESFELSDSATNHLQSATYDAAGNVLNWYSLPGAPVFEYYPGNALRKASGLNLNETYGYTADGERIATYKALEGTNGTYQVTLRNLGGKVLRLFEVSDGVWTEKQDWVYRGGALLATFEGGVEKHYHLDHLGSPRLVTSATGAGLEVREYRPFGEGATTTTDRMRFTGHERDQASGLDYLHARYYNPNVARFLSVDPGRDWDPTQPQSWNLYAYVRNNPLGSVDPDGRTEVEVVVVRTRETPNFITGYYFVTGTTISGFTTELPWRFNAPYVSAIPHGTYNAVVGRMWKSKVDALLLLDVPDRSDIFMHGGKSVEDSEGCLLVGLERRGTGDGLRGGIVARQQLVDHVRETERRDRAAGDETTTIKVKILPRRIIDWDTSASSFTLFPPGGQWIGAFPRPGPTGK